MIVTFEALCSNVFFAPAQSVECIVEIRERVLQAVLDAGFDRAGCLPLAEAGDPRIKEWIAGGFHGEMRYLERHAPVKESPAAGFPDYKSVIVAALEYGQVAPEPSSPKQGNISRYALGDDYHVVLKRRLLDAAERIRNELPSLHARAFVDADPLNEKLIAARAGIGWVGRHTNLIDPKCGSYFFLGLLLVDADLQATGPVEPDRCGLCTACIPACPTGAIIAPYVLDARRCISYLTIELKGPIPRDLRHLIGNRIFGCDDCQEVCPWNRFARLTPPAPFRARSELRERTLREWLALTVEEWRTLFEGSALERTGYLGFVRNVLVASGCSSDPTLVPAVTAYLRHESTLLRGHAAWALGQLGGPEAQAALTIAHGTEVVPEIRMELTEALTKTYDSIQKKVKPVGEHIYNMHGSHLFDGPGGIVPERRLM